MIAGTWVGALIGHLILVPLWTMSPLPVMLAITLVCCGGSWALLGIAIALALAAIYLVRVPFQPWLVRLFYALDMPRYYAKCELRGPHLGKLEGRERTLFLFHPHGVLAAGFTINGCWGRPFNALTAKNEGRDGKGVVFLIARTLREWPSPFKLLCDMSGRLESATKETMTKLMAQGRNLAIIPGGFESATLTAYGKHREMLMPRKGLVKYALQHGCARAAVCRRVQPRAAARRLKHGRALPWHGQTRARGH